MTGDISAATGGRVIGPGSLRISKTGLDYDIGRSRKVKMNRGPVGKAVVANRAITGRVPSLQVATFTVRPDGPRKCRAIRREIMAGNAAARIGDRVHNMAVEAASRDTTNAIQVRTMTKSAH
jgi:hypothetical protein